MTAPERNSTGAAEGRRQAPDEVLELVTGRLRLIADPMRVRIIRHLETCGTATVQEICDAVRTPHQNGSKHLRLLLSAGMVIREREGNTMRYELADFTVPWVLDKMTASVKARLEEQVERFADA